MVAAVYVVLAFTGLMIYLGQGNYFSAKHIHAWFGVLFFVAAVFHIINNWSSIKNYSVNRKAGGLRRELFLPVLITLVFTIGIAADLPVFKDLANAGKRAFGPEKKKERRLSQLVVDSIARKLMTDYTTAISQGDTATLAQIVAKQALISSEAGSLVKGVKLVKSPALPMSTEPLTVRIEEATALDDQVIVATGTTSGAKSEASPVRFTNVMQEADGHWRMAALQLTPLTPAPTIVAVR